MRSSHLYRSTGLGKQSNVTLLEFLLLVDKVNKNIMSNMVILFRTGKRVRKETGEEVVVFGFCIEFSCSLFEQHCVLYF